MTIETKLTDWNKLTKLRVQIDNTENKQRKTDLIRNFVHQADLYKTKYEELYTPVYPPQE